MLVCLVTGGRSFIDRQRVSTALDRLKPDIVIEGGAAGADALARVWCNKNGVNSITCNAAWTKHKRRAGHVRNRFMGQLVQMLASVPTFKQGGVTYDQLIRTCCLHFPGGTGTANMVAVARAMGIDLIEG